MIDGGKGNGDEDLAGVAGALLVWRTGNDFKAADDDSDTEPLSWKGDAAMVVADAVKEHWI